MIRLQFIGATGTVTGSKYRIEFQKKHYLLDCGLFQGLKVLRLRNWRPLPVKPSLLEAVILTHAHIDHSGYLPLLVKNGFRGKIYSTRGTRALCQILLPDAGHLQEEDAFFANKHKFSRHRPALPLYTERDAIESLRYFETAPWEKKISLTKHLSFRFLPAGHILGASLVQVNADGVRITFSGDLGRQKILVMDRPEPVEESDYLVVESTYGDRYHSGEDPLLTLKRLVRKTFERGGITLIPAFAVGRAQEVLHLITRLKKRGEIPNLPVYLNSPMAVEATRLYRDFMAEHTLTDEDCRDIWETTDFVSTVEESKRLNGLKTPSLIISASGMAEGGRILHHLKALAPDPKNLILFVGFQATGTRGEAILNHAGQIKIHGERIPVRAEIESIDTLSAHADQGEILTWLKHFKKPPRMTFITHGEPAASEALRKKIEEKLHWPCKVPDYLEIDELK